MCRDCWTMSRMLQAQLVRTMPLTAPVFLVAVYLPVHCYCMPNASGRMARALVLIARQCHACCRRNWCASCI
jgi:hypothetical protein